MINTERFLQFLDEQAQFGATPEGGVSRPALSKADMEVRDWFRAQIEAAGLEYHVDGAGNQSGIWRSERPNAKTLLIGSHLDSVINGGRFDGPLGVLSALEALLSLREADIPLPFHLEVISFTDEEGNLVGLLGSQALTGQLRPEQLQNPRGGRDTLLAGLERANLSEDSLLSAQRDPKTLLGYMEVHIEQGRRLELTGTDVGVVTSLVGMRDFWLHYKGTAAHAGAQPMLERRDALWGAVEFAQQARQVVLDDFLPGVCNIGRIDVQPGAFNIVPAGAAVALELRHGTDELMDVMERRLLEVAHDAAQMHRLDLTTEVVNREPAAYMDTGFMAAIEGACGVLGLSSQRLMSFALHDAQVMSKITPSALFFVPSVDGTSHNPSEYTRPEDCINAANVMTHTIKSLAKGVVAYDAG